MKISRFAFLACVLVFVGTSVAETSRSATPTPSRTKRSATPKSDSDDDDAKPKPKSSPAKKKPAPDDGDEPAATPRPKPKVPIDEKSDEVKKKETDAVPPPGATPSPKTAPPASIESSELANFKEQPEKVQQLIEAALALSKLGLTYKYGSDDPANGGMDCSGSVSYLLRQQGFKDVPRDSAGQYVWARKRGQFFAVISKKAGGFEFDDLKPGDLMFWSGTYAIDRDPPVTHSMIYLGQHRTRKQLVMWGASDGRSYDGKSRYGVGVFDFKMPRAGGEGEGATAVGNHPDFLGYARIPGLREEAKPETAQKEERAAPDDAPAARKHDDTAEATPKPRTPVKKKSTR